MKTKIPYIITHRRYTFWTLSIQLGKQKSINTEPIT